VELSVNQHTVTVAEEYRDDVLLWALRDGLGLTGTHYGCGIGKCGACMVLVDDMPTRSCQATTAELAELAETSIVTIEGLTAEGQPLSAVQEAFAEFALQCMWCLPGHLITARALLANHPRPTAAEIEESMAENLCRCGGYNQVRKAIARAIELTAAATERDGKP
jgi:aerobic-type carbon monoxide dehydrogenase small subunit (CoxS/CutS family)